VSPFVEAGNVHLPSPSIAPWVGDFIEELRAFPAAAHDDQVDAMTQALQRIFLAGASTTSYLHLLAPGCDACGTPTLARDGYVCRNCANDDPFSPPRDVTCAELPLRRLVDDTTPDDNPGTGGFAAAL
jgi:hypothetical protein